MEGSSHASWSLGLDYVLLDRPALDAFRSWLVEYCSPQYLDLYFAIRAYERMAMERNAKTIDLAKSIYSTYLSSRLKGCDKISREARHMVGEKVRSMNSNVDADPKLFSVVSNLTHDVLKKQHQKFVMSDEFVDAFNKMSLMEQESVAYNTVDRKKQHNWRRSHAPFLTAETLLRTRHERQNTLGEAKLEKMFSSGHQPAVPYVCHATTSHNDSAVSSSFSSDAGTGARFRHAKEEQLRGNPVGAVVPRVENKGGSQPYDHASAEGRESFARLLTKKLNRVLDKRRRNEEMERQINDVEQRKYTAFDMLSSTTEGIEDQEEDEELDDYMKKMRDDSMREESLRASANRSPPTQPTFNRTFSPSREVKDPMSHSLIAYPRKTDDGFAPPPTFHHFATLGRTSKVLYDSHGCDSSGIGSTAPSSFSNASTSNSGRRSLGTTPRKPVNPYAVARKKGEKRPSGSLITISYKGADGVPVVAHVPYDGPMTLKQFRKDLSLNSKSQCFFKAECEDGSAPYQLLLVNDDSQTLPIFEGKITAEVKSKLVD